MVKRSGSISTPLTRATKGVPARANEMVLPPTHEVASVSSNGRAGSGRASVDVAADSAGAGLSSASSSRSFTTRFVMSSAFSWSDTLNSASLSRRREKICERDAFVHSCSERECNAAAGAGIVKETG
jgi:hypothetical protein